MTPPRSGPASGRPVIDAGRLWAGGAATAAVAALVGLVGVLIAEGLFNVTMVRPPLLPIGGSFAVQYAVTAAVLALVATLIAHLLALSAPRPQAFLGWIIGLATLVGVVLPFALEGTLVGRIATSIVNLLIGTSILSLLRSVLVRTVRPGAPLYP